MAKTIRNGDKNGHRTKAPTGKGKNGNGNGNGNGKSGNPDLILEDAAPTDHHIVPSSRMHEDGYKEFIGRNNLTEVPNGKHISFHRLFFNLTPPEIIALLVDEFWDGQIHWVKSYLDSPEYYSEEKEKRKQLRKNNGKSARQK